MSGFSILMIIFGICTFLTGLYMFSGHKLEMLSWKAAYKNLNKNQWKNLGKWTMIVTVIPIILAILGIIFDF